MNKKLTIHQCTGFGGVRLFRAGLREFVTNKLCWLGYGNTPQAAAAAAIRLLSRWGEDALAEACVSGLLHELAHGRSLPHAIELADAHYAEVSRNPPYDSDL